MWNKIKWVLLAVVKPLAVLWLIFNGLPPSIRAVADGVTKVIKAINR